MNPDGQVLVLALLMNTPSHNGPPYWNHEGTVQNNLRSFSINEGDFIMNYPPNWNKNETMEVNLENLK